MTDKGMVVLQNSMNIEKCVPGPCIETYPTSSHDAYQAMNIKVEEDSDIQEEEEHPVPMAFIGVKVEQEVSCVSTVRKISHTTRIAYCLSCVHLCVCQYKNALL
jgi:hypothetical protein